MFKTTLLFFATALCEIIGCFLPWLWLKRGASALLLIPAACNMFGIPNDLAMQVVAVGFIIGVLQDSAETALNSSTDILFTAAVCQAEADRKTSRA